MAVCKVTDGSRIMNVYSIDIDKKGSFSIANSDHNTANERSPGTIRKRIGSKKELAKNEKSRDNPERVATFRPFGVLEPSSAKAARGDIRRAIHLICRIASIKSELLRVITQYNILRSELSRECSPVNSKKCCQVGAWRVALDSLHRGIHICGDEKESWFWRIFGL